MRVIAGRFKGLRLIDFKAGHIRPTTDRVKETVFNKLMHQIDGARVLDLFAGTGNLSIEALSRGASEVDCVENHRVSLKIINDNLRKLKIDKEIKVKNCDVFLYLKKYSGPPYDIIFIDPPFTKSLAHKCMQAIASSRVSGQGTIVVIESSKQETIEDQYSSFQLLDRKAFGDKSASFFIYKNMDNEDGSSVI